MKTRQITEFGMLLAIGLVLSYFETLLPVFVAVPGVKLGLANIITMLYVYARDFRSGLLFMSLRILMSGFLFSGISGIVYSFAGGVCCIVVMSLLKRLSFFSILGVSMAGAIFHNIGQIIVAMFMMENTHILYYLPVLMISGAISGFAIGYVTFFLLKRFKNEI